MLGGKIKRNEETRQRERTRQEKEKRKSETSFIHLGRKERRISALIKRRGR